jgi:hypothetical protein
LNLFGQNQIVEAWDRNRHAALEVNRPVPIPERIELEKVTIDGRHGTRDQNVDVLVILEHIATGSSCFVRRTRGYEVERRARSIEASDIVDCNPVVIVRG